MPPDWTEGRHCEAAKGRRECQNVSIAIRLNLPKRVAAMAVAMAPGISIPVTLGDNMGEL